MIMRRREGRRKSEVKQNGEIDEKAL